VLSICDQNYVPSSQVSIERAKGEFNLQLQVVHVFNHNGKTTGNGEQRTSSSGEKAWLASQYSHRFALL
jgi:hypothetical protein